MAITTHSNFKLLTSKEVIDKTIKHIGKEPLKEFIDHYNINIYDKLKSLKKSEISVLDALEIIGVFETISILYLCCNKPLDYLRLMSSTIYLNLLDSSNLKSSDEYTFNKMKKALVNLNVSTNQLKLISLLPGKTNRNVFIEKQNSFISIINAFTSKQNRLEFGGDSLISSLIFLSEKIFGHTLIKDATKKEIIRYFGSDIISVK